MRLILIIALTIFSTLSAFSQHQITIDRDIAAYNEACITRNYDKQIKYSIQSVIQLGGGEELMKDVATEQAGKMMASKTKVISLVPNWYSTVYKSVGAIHVVVGQQQVRSISGRKFERTAYYLAESIDEGDSWSFIDLEAYDAEALQLYVPGISKDLVIPSPSATVEIRE